MVELSARAEEFLRIRSRLEGAGIDRDARIAELRDQLSRGTYRVDPALVAGAMLRDEAVALMFRS